MKETNTKEPQWENYDDMRKRVEAEDAKKKEKTKGKKINVVYAEPVDYFSEETRRKFKLGEFAEPKEEEAKPTPAEYDRWGKVGIRFTDEPTDK